MTLVRWLIWDGWNVRHVARHKVTRDEVEEVCHGLFITREAYAGRLMLIGPTRADRTLAVVLEPVEEGVFYPVTARTASRKERRLYLDERLKDESEEA